MLPTARKVTLTTVVYALAILALLDLARRAMIVAFDIGWLTEYPMIRDVPLPAAVNVLLWLSLAAFLAWDLLTQYTIEYSSAGIHLLTLKGRQLVPWPALTGATLRRTKFGHRLTLTRDFGRPLKIQAGYYQDPELLLAYLRGKAHRIQTTVEDRR